MRIKVKPIIIKDTLFGLPVLIYTNIPYESLIEAGYYDDHETYEEHENTKIAGGCCFMKNIDDLGHVIVWIAEFEKHDPISIGVLSHELNHAAMFILDRIGINNQSRDVEEVLCYLQEFLLVESLKKLK